MLHLIVCSALLLGASDKEAERMGVAQTDVERAARDYRIQIYQSYRLDRPEYDARRELGDRLLDGFVAAGSPKAYQEDVLNWFRTSEERSRDGEAGELPVLPELPDPLPGHVAQDDPTRAPHYPGMDRLHVEIPTSATDTGFLGTPTPVNLHHEDHKGDGVLFETESKILRSIQRALFSPSSMDHSADQAHDGAEEAQEANAETQNDEDSRAADPFAPRGSDGNKAAPPSLTKPGN